MSISLLLELGKNEVRIGDLPEATVRVLNEGPGMCIVNGRMLLAPVSTPKTLKEISFLISGPEGSVNLRKFFVNSGRPSIENFVRLFPGEYIFQTYELSKYFSYEMAGKYKITAEYSNALKVEVHDTISWVGKIISNEEYFEIND